MNQDLAGRLREVLLDGRWVANTNIKEQISQTSWQEAIQKIGSLNTVAMLTYHVSYYLGGLSQVFEGGELEIRDKFSFDMPEIKSEADWKALVNNFIVISEKFVNQVEKMDADMLNQTFVKEAYGSYLRNIEAQIEHAYYHLGQITLIRKLIAEKG